MSRTSIRHVATALSAAWLVAIWVTFAGWRGNPVDAWAYWSAGQRDELYRLGEYAYVYSPAAYQLAAPLLALPFEAFVAALRAAELAALLALAGPAAGIAVLLPPVAAEINAANINLLLMAAVVGGFRWPALWAFPILTKVTPGIGLLWFAVRREWRSLALAAGTTAAIAGASLLLAPHLWADWIALLAATDPLPGWPFPWPLWWRLPLAVALVVWGARTDRRWTLALAVIVGLPKLYFLSIGMLVGLLPLMRRLRVASRPG